MLGTAVEKFEPDDIRSSVQSSRWDEVIFLMIPGTSCLWSLDISRKRAQRKFRGLLWPEGPRLEACAKHDRILPLAGLDLLGRPKGENRIAHGLQPWEDVPQEESPCKGGGVSVIRSHSEFPQHAGAPAEFLSRRQRGQSGAKED